MSFWEKNRNKIIVAAVAAAALFVAFFWGAADKSREEQPAGALEAAAPAEEEAKEKAPALEKTDEIKPEEKAEPPKADVPAAPAAVPESGEMTLPVQTEGTAEPEKKENLCTISISCNTAVSRGEVDFLPADGLILPETTVSFTAGESVFDVLCRVTRENKIHMEFVNTPVYGSAYIEGIGNLYEYDLGPLSGWMYRVNGVFPGYGCSGFTLSDGDRIEWVYTCDLGKDVGGDYSANSGELNE